MKGFISCVLLLLTVAAQLTTPTLSVYGLTSSKIDQDQLINSIFGVQISTSVAPLQTSTLSTSDSICPPKAVVETSSTSLTNIEIEVTPTIEEEPATTQIIEDSDPSNGTILDKIVLAIENSTVIYEENANANETVEESIDESIEDCHFMSFEEWKKQKQVNDKNLSDVIDSNLTVTPDLPNNETIPEVSPHSELVNYDSTVVTNVTEKEDKKVTEEAGKTYKNKFNFASVDCAATVVKTNSQAKGASSILTENKDSYLLNECSSENKFVIIELCQDILVENVVIGNYEFFSSMFKKIRISVSDRFPVPQPQGWKLLGEFEALNIRDVQTFTIENPLIWARYLKLEILSHYGDEFYCPLSVVRVHGKTMMDELKENDEQKQEAPPEEIVAQTSAVSELPNYNNHSFNLNLLDFENDDECKVILPHLRLVQFLNNLNSSEICNANELSSDYNLAASSASASSSSIQLKSTITTQESIYKNIIKRLSLLESNASLSLLYIEEQSKLLSTAFSNLEKRQSKKFEKLITNFNSTLVNQLIYFKNSYSLIQKDTLNYFSNHENLINNYNQKIVHINSDLRFQKILLIFNSFIIVCILAYVIITRDAYVDIDSYYEDEYASPSPKTTTTRLFPIGFSKKSKKKNSKFRSKKKGF